MTEAIRGKDVTVDKFHRARCHRDGCGWTGGEHATYAAANAERQAHLDEHILAAGRAPGLRQHPFVREAGRVADADGRVVTVGVDRGTVTLAAPGWAAGAVRLTAVQAEQFGQLYIAACWAAARDCERMAEKLAGGAT